MAQLLIRHVRIIDPGAATDKIGDIRIENGVISETGVALTPGVGEVIDADGLAAAPGLVDMHVHLRDPGYTYKEDVFTGCEAAAAGGVTAVAAMPNTNPVMDSPESVRKLLEKGARARAHVWPIAAITKGQQGRELTDFSALKRAGAVAFSDDGVPVATAKLMAQAMKQAEMRAVPILAHCEEPTLSDGLINEGRISESIGVPGIPGSAEDVGTARELSLALSLHTRVHICHVSTAASVQMIRDFKQNGVRVTAETCPHYFMFHDEMCLSQDADYRMNPPLRADYDRRAVLRGIMDGTIDAIATDHAPHTAEEKQDFYTAPNGVVGLETSLAAGITCLVGGGYITLFQLLYLMSTHPARLLGIPGGNLQPGSPADLVLFDPQEKWRVRPEKLHSKSINTPFKGMELTGRVRTTVCRGEVVYHV